MVRVEAVAPTLYTSTELRVNAVEAEKTKPAPPGVLPVLSAGVKRPPDIVEPPSEALT